MRKVALTLAVLSVFTILPPATATNDCVMDLGEAVLCMEIPVERPSSPPGVPGVPREADPYFGRYYLWIGAGPCAGSILSNNCAGRPVAGGSGVPTPVGPVGAGVFGILYEESNDLTGLQRQQVFGGNPPRAPDRTILV